jgi:hypothetical protein
VALFGRGGGKEKTPQDPEATRVRPVVGRKAFCRICNAHRDFSRCWLPVAPMTRCACCGMVYEEPALLYKRTMPTCPRCGEYLEQPGFEYGLCDTCGSKFELAGGTRPSLLPNKAQRAEMDKFGKAWRQE